jgi:hypothetical protein
LFVYNTKSGNPAAGANATIFRTFSPNKWRQKVPICTQITAVWAEKYQNIGFEEKKFRRNLVKIAKYGNQKIDHRSLTSNNVQ